jgi:hypothetical protein
MSPTRGEKDPGMKLDRRGKRVSGDSQEHACSMSMDLDRRREAMAGAGLKASKYVSKLRGKYAPKPRGEHIRFDS